jgi:hypothetical protein
MVALSHQQLLRLAAYWLTVVAFAGALTWVLCDGFERARLAYLEKVGVASINHR